MLVFVKTLIAQPIKCRLGDKAAYLWTVGGTKQRDALQTKTKPPEEENNDEPGRLKERKDKEDKKESLKGSQEGIKKNGHTLKISLIRCYLS